MWTGEQICLLHQHKLPLSPSLLTTCFRLSVPSILQIKSWSELSALVKTYFCFTIVSLLVLLSLTVSSIYKQHKDTDVSDEDNFTVSLIQLVGICECFTFA